MLERNILKYKKGNNIIRMVMKLSNDEAYTHIENAIKSSEFIHWIANISLKTPFFLNPYWKYVNASKTIEIHEHNGSFSEIPEVILNHNFDLRKDQLLRFDNYRTVNNELILVMSFHHILLDGRGSGLIIRHLTGNMPFTAETINDFFPKRIKKINFVRHTINMFQVKKFVEHTMRKPIGNFEKVNGCEHQYLLSTIHFSEDETKIIDENAKINGARFGSNLYQIAVCAHAVHDEMPVKKDIWVPIPYDGRKRGSVGPVVSNNISFLFYRLAITNDTTIKETVTAIQKQMNEQLKLEMPRKYFEFLQFIKFIPKRFTYWMTTRAGKGEISSFLYSSSGESFWDTSRFSNELIDTLLIPPFTYPPGISITFLRFDGQLKMNIAVSSDKIDKNHLYLFEKKITKLLLQSSSVEKD